MEMAVRMAAASKNASKLTSLQSAIAFEPFLSHRACSCGRDDLHSDPPLRVMSVFQYLTQNGFLEKCTKIFPRNATVDEIKV